MDALALLADAAMTNEGYMISLDYSLAFDRLRLGLARELFLQAGLPLTRSDSSNMTAFATLLASLFHPACCSCKERGWVWEEEEKEAGDDADVPRPETREQGTEQRDKNVGKGKGKGKGSPIPNPPLHRMPVTLERGLNAYSKMLTPIRVKRVALRVIISKNLKELLRGRLEAKERAMAMAPRALLSLLFLFTTMPMVKVPSNPFPKQKLHLKKVYPQRVA